MVLFWLGRARLNSCQPGSGAPQELQDLIRRLLRRNPAHRLGMQRAGAADVKNHPWFAKFDWDAFSRRALPAPYIPQVRKDIHATHSGWLDPESSAMCCLP